MTKKKKQVVLKPDVYEVLKKQQVEKGIQIQHFVNKTLRERLGLEKPA